MPKNLLRFAWCLVFISSCVTASRNSHQKTVSKDVAEVDLPAGIVPVSMTDLSRTEEGGFVLAPGFYETELKTYCLQPGTPDPSPRDAYLQGSITGYRKDIVETILYNSRKRPDIPQRNVQLLLWSTVSGSDFNKLSPTVRSDAAELVNSRQLFELRGGVMGLVKTVSSNIPGGLGNGYGDIKRLFETGSSTYEAVEQMAVLRQASVLKRQDFKNDQWYKQDGNYYLRYFPVSYQKVKVQVYVPDGILDAEGKRDGEYLVFDPTGLQVIPANSNAQRLGIGGPVVDIVRAVIKINKKSAPVKKIPKEKGGKTVPPVKT